MNMEQFQMILDMVQNVTDGALTVAIIYMVYMVLVEFMLPIILTGTVSFLAYKVLRHVVTAASFTNELKQIRDGMGVGVPGPITNEEIRRMHAWVARKRG